MITVLLSFVLLLIGVALLFACGWSAHLGGRMEDGLMMIAGIATTIIIAAFWIGVLS
jgi:glucose dehydrogenase